MRRKSFSLLIIIVIMSFVLSGCFGPNGNGNDDENSVWATYEHDYFALSYPEEWNILQERISEYEWDEKEFKRKIVSIGDGMIDEEDEEWIEEPNEIIAIDFKIEGEEITDEDWEERKEELEKNYESEVSEMNIDGEPAYKLTIVDEDPVEEFAEKVTADLVFIYKNNFEHQITYGGFNDNYNEEMGEEIIDSFEFK